MDLRRSPASASESASEKVDRLFERLGAVDHYALLGVPRDAETQLIQSAHSLRRTLFRTMPTAGSQGAKCRAIVAAIDAAWETLRDSSRRAVYDRTMPPSTRAVSLPPERAVTTARTPQVLAAPSRPSPVPTPPPFAASEEARSAMVPPRMTTTPIPARVLPPLPEARMQSGVALSPPLAATRPSHTTPIPAMARDPWAVADISEMGIHDEVEALSSALQLVLGALAERGADPLLDDARHELAYLQTRRTVRQAREHETGERWAMAARAWTRAANTCSDDPWLLAHAAHALSFAEPSSAEIARLARRALALDENNPLAREVLIRAA